MIDALTSIWAYRLIRWLLSIVFLYAGATKLADPKAFGTLIDAYGIVPDQLLMPVAVGLPLLEVVAAIGLIVDVRGSLAIISGLMALFITILIYGIRMGLDVECGCFTNTVFNQAFAGVRGIVLDVCLLGCLAVESIGQRRLHTAAAPADPQPPDDPTATQAS